MGDAADSMINGLMCELCGVLIDGDEPGYPRRCGGCGGSKKRKKSGGRGHKQARKGRVDSASKSLDATKKRMLNIGVTVQVFNDGMHWRFASPTRTYEWWPSRGRMVVDRNYSNPMFSTAVDEVATLIESIEKNGEATP